MTNQEILKQVGNEAKSRRGELINAFKKQGKKGNVIINLQHGFSYKYGKTILEPQIVFPGMNAEQMCDWDFWDKC